ncbi:hypothetical protein FIV42_19085 [Persicimonas caeni]|uniref:Protein kinase domain-containing protein n=1 Tax=Persicimonas caeni TaxID=2292766 RepID=A0A4Y6PX08_PERCE|nr:serine/threonine-protein kinase [Persicimonas caeni]QDG52770.1 hypothetical protein FIV42_19085 [Persicimonas caeni]QED33992.1 protein kinase [Persicimonas caeni]
MSDKTSASAGGSSTAGRQSKARKPYDPEKLIGKTIGGRYLVEKCIGKGGMGVVYLASQKALDRKVVIKVLPSSFVDDEEALGRFEREAVGMSRLQHPHVVAIYDFGHEDDHAYICMEYVDGETLSRRIKRDGPLDVETFAPIAGQILKGIGEAHSLGLVHRDIKPSNIMLTERHGQENYAKILDFGLAKLVKGSQNVTKEQALVGSTAFMAPEQIMGNDIDQRVDVYALGVLFYYMLSAEKPFQSDDDITVLYQHVHNPPPPLADKLPEGHRVPAEVIGLIERMLAKEPEDRPTNAAMIHDELADIMATTSLQIPWNTGEFGSLSGSSPIEDPSDRLGRGRFQTPMGQASPGTSPSGLHQPGSGTQFDTRPSQATFITNEQMLELQKQSTRRTLIIGMVAMLVVAGGLAAFLLLRDTGPSVEDVQGELAKAERLVDEGKFGQAASVLELLQSDLEHHPSLKSRYAASQDKLAVARLMSEAKLFEEQDKLEEAASTYGKVLSRNPEHDEARAALAKVQSQQRELREEKERSEQEEVREQEEVKEQKSEEAAAEAVEEEPVAESKPAAKPRPSSKPSKTSKPSKPVEKPASKPKKASDDNLLLPIGEQEAEEPSNDDVQLLPMD